MQQLLKEWAAYRAWFAKNHKYPVARFTELSEIYSGHLWWKKRVGYDLSIAPLLTRPAPEPTFVGFMDWMCQKELEKEKRHRKR